MPAMSKTSLFAKMKVHPGKRDEALAALVAALPAANDEDGTEIYSFHADKSDADTIWVFELYTDDAALGVHGQSPAVAELFGTLGDLLAEPPMMVIADVHAGKGV
jgi:quinol monooxygenase YgiN